MPYWSYQGPEPLTHEQWISLSLVFMDIITIYSVFSNIYWSRAEDFPRFYTFLLWGHNHPIQSPKPCTCTKGHEFHNSDKRLYGHHNLAFSFLKSIFMGVEEIFRDLIHIYFVRIGQTLGPDPITLGSWISQIL